MTIEPKSSAFLLDFDARTPVQVKKQDKYNIYRWATGGRNNLWINAACYRILAWLKSKPHDAEAWRELVYLWSSDFRTHITPGRFDEFKRRLGKMLIQTQMENQRTRPGRVPFQFKESTAFFEISTGKLDMKINRLKGLTIEHLNASDSKVHALIGRINHGTYDDISYSSDYYSGYAICYDNDRRQHTHLFPRGEMATWFEDHLLIEAQTDCDSKYVVSDKLRIYRDYVEIHRTIRIVDQQLSMIHPFIFTFIPSKSQRHFWYRTACGGTKPSTYALTTPLAYDEQTMYLTVTAVNGFSPTDGVLLIGRQGTDECIRFENDNTASPLVAGFLFQPDVGIENEKFSFLQVIFSAQEINDTFKGNSERNTNIESRMKISIEKTEVVK